MMTLYEGRVKSRPNALMDALNRSLPVDIRLLPQDLRTNRAWAGELARLGIYTRDEFRSVADALSAIHEEYESGAFHPLPDDEDVHTLVERLLTERLGDIGARIHTGRSRNDQVACDLRLFLMDAADRLHRDIHALIGVLATRIEEHKKTLLAGTTHLQPAQPITLGHFLSSLAFALIRDAGRIGDARRRAALCPLGSGALAGSGFPVDRRKLADSLGFEGVLENSLDAVSDRDAAQETAAACAVLAGHLSRYAEQFVIWSHPSFGYVRFSDDWSTGSSMMPQKRNPDAMELVRGKAARVIGDCTTLLCLTKGVPLSYAKDLQEDKAALFDSVDTAGLCLGVFAKAVENATFFPENMERALSADLLATDLADALSAAGMPFRRAHAVVAELVTELEQRGKGLLDVPPSELAERFEELRDQAFSLDFSAAVERRAVVGGPAEKSMDEQLERLRVWTEENAP